MSTSSPQRLQLLTSVEAFHDLQPYWNPLLRSTTNDSVFLTFEYLEAWWKIYGPNCHLRIVAAWEGDRLIGLAPFSIALGRSGLRRWLRHLGFLGSQGHELSECLDFIIAPGYEQELTQRFLCFAHEELGNEWDLLYLNLVPAQSEHLASLAPLAHARGFPSRLLANLAAPYLPLPESWEELLQSKSKNFRKQFNNHWNRLHKQHKVEILHAGDDLGIDEAFDVLLSLNRCRWGAEGQAFTTQKTRCFHRCLAHRFHELGQLCFLLMKIDGSFAAARFDYVYGGKLWNIQGGWQPQYANLSPGRMLLGWQMQWCIEQGLQEYDFLVGEADYKRSWATQERRLVNVEWFLPESRRSRIFLGLRRLKDRLRTQKREPAAGISSLPAHLT